MLAFLRPRIGPVFGEDTLSYGEWRNKKNIKFGTDCDMYITRPSETPCKKLQKAAKKNAFFALHMRARRSQLHLIS